MARGGFRPNSGRKAGEANKKTKEIADRAITEGITPLEVMLKAMRHFCAIADESDGDAKTSALKEAAVIAKDAAPYIHPRLASIEHAGKGGGAIQVNVTIGAKA